LLNKILSIFKNEKTLVVEDKTDQTQLAVAAILVEAARADENYAIEEQQIIDAALQNQFSLDNNSATALRKQGEEAQATAVDLHQFTKVAKEMPEANKIQLIETLWKIVLSDGDRDQYENALMRRLCGLLYIDDRASGEARQRVETSMNG